MANYPSIDRLAELQQMIAEFAGIERVIQYAHLKRFENDAEHSFGLALTCWYLQPKIAPELDMLKIFKYAIAHDLVEIHSGDTYIFDAKNLVTKEQRERDAVARLKLDWDDFSEMTQATENYMDKIDEEAKFVKAVDKLIGPILIDLSNNRDFWNDRSITLEMIIQNKKSILISDVVGPYYEKLIEWLDKRDVIPKV